MNSKKRDILIMGFALFAIFFGAGNLIFPPMLGNMAGSRWSIATAGFLSTDPVLPILGVIATALVGGRPEDLGKRVSPRFGIFLSAIAILLIGPILSVPRTAATTFEIAIKPYINSNYSNMAMVGTSIIFFAVTYYFCMNESNVINIIGKFLTPGLLIVLAAIIIKCIFIPIGPIVETDMTNPYHFGFTEGYQTMDALGSPLMCGIVLTDLIRKGYTTRKEQKNMIIKVGIVAGVLLMFIYGGLAFVGATTSSIPETDRVLLLLKSINSIYGNTGKIIMGVAVTLACLTTSVGLIATAGNFFNYTSKGRISYIGVVRISIIVSTLISLLSVSGIVKLATPMLLTIFPIIIVLIFLTLFDNYIKYDLSYVGPVISAGIIGLIDALHSTFNMFDKLYSYIEMLPFAKSGFPWLVPSIIFFIVFTILGALIQSKDTKKISL
ncbi:branched-chain amino acid transport system II carrier protein [Anaerosphaera multitolerans]|uniref:Branched-chain amino acid transport system carrier protein n=1 Tax=Anaerosphaera multitolerans TaxID=2487351 RepID=A0A437S629_9FIRM|nr:branched-chain amino acid transport system II carrier protein [Anaerosphaera multitolerans]RVU54485.1 branched-chain amino acid transport system II carrier protein [Anaerosphaera multitolerans]